MTLKHSKIALIGMAGVGKSTFGKRLAKKETYSFIDTDTLIEKELDCSIKETIAHKGEKAFKTLEETVITNFVIPDNCILATGGSVVHSEAIMKYLSKHCHIVWLCDDLAHIMKRIPDYKNRGIIMNKHSSFESLYTERKTLYKRYANTTIHYPETFHAETILTLIQTALS